jgi:hypothetical protein
VRQSAGATARFVSPHEAGPDFDRLSRTIFGAGSDPLWLVSFDAPLLAGELLAARPWQSAVRPSRGLSSSGAELRPFG